MNLDKLRDDIEHTLSILRSSDFDNRNGINEAGFKVAVISAILLQTKRLKDYLVESEVGIALNSDRYGFIDLVVRDESRETVYIIELKYIRMNFINDQRVKCGATRFLKQERSKVEKKRVGFTKYSDPLRELRIRTMNDNNHQNPAKKTPNNSTTTTTTTTTTNVLTVEEYASETFKQAGGYTEAYIEKYYDGKECSKVVTVVMIGVGHRVYIDETTRYKNTTSKLIDYLYSMSLW